jgi:hypothetical protein
MSAHVSYLGNNWNNNIVHHYYRTPTLKLEEDDELCLSSYSTIAKKKKNQKKWWQAAWLLLIILSFGKNSEWWRVGVLLVVVTCASLQTWNFKLCVCRFHLECETTVGNIVVWWMDQQWGIAVTFWNMPQRYDWTEWRSWWCVWTDCFQTIGNSTKWCQHTAALDKDHSALPIHHCQLMKTYMPILGFYPFWDSGSFGTSETVEEKKTWGTAGWFNSKLAAFWNCQAQ